MTSYNNKKQTQEPHHNDNQLSMGL